MDDGVPVPHWDDAFTGDTFFDVVNNYTLAECLRSVLITKKSVRLRLTEDGRQGNQSCSPPRTRFCFLRCPIG